MLIEFNFLLPNNVHPELIFFPSLCFPKHASNNATPLLGNSWAQSALPLTQSKVNRAKFCHNVLLFAPNGFSYHIPSPPGFAVSGSSSVVTLSRFTVSSSIDCVFPVPIAYTYSQQLSTAMALTVCLSGWMLFLPHQYRPLPHHGSTVHPVSSVDQFWLVITALPLFRDLRESYIHNTGIGGIQQSAGGLLADAMAKREH